MNILLIEDEPSDLKLVSLILRTGGHCVLEQASAHGAVEKVRSCRPELILMDLNLPGLNGLTLVRQLKADPDTQAIPIVAITAAPELFTRGEALAAGCDAFIAKPIDTRRLPEAVTALVSR